MNTSLIKIYIFVESWVDGSNLIHSYPGNQLHFVLIGGYSIVFW